MFNEDGRKTLTEVPGPYSDMLQTVTVHRMAAGDKLKKHLDTEELAILLIEGQARYHWDGENRDAQRDSFMSDKPWCLHVPKGVEVSVEAVTDCEILLQSTANEKSFEPVFYTPDDCREDTFGQGEFEGKAIRTVRTIFDYTNAPYSNMVMGEIVIPQGGWSSYPPHHHPQPEVYYYRFEKPQGFGCCFIGDSAHVIKDGSFAAIPGGLCHPQVNAPGYPMYYVWMIRHLDGNPWTDRFVADEHMWLLKSK